MAFDASRKKQVEIDLEKPFFKVVRPHDDPTKCNHHNRGVTLDVKTRRVYCKCGEQIDTFDALLIYANAERRLQNDRAALDEHKRKEAEQKAKKAFVQRVRGASAIYGRNGRTIRGYHITLECGHPAMWFRKRPKMPREMQCPKCFDEAQAKIRRDKLGLA